MSGPAEAYRALLKAREQRPAALVRGEDGNLHMRHFETVEDANRASHHLTFVNPDAALPAPARRGRARIRLAAAAAEIGVCAKTFKRYLRHIRHEHPSPNVVLIPRSEMDLLKVHGLHGLARIRASSAL